ncbi:hypothetical protein RHO14_07375 [Orbus wheelerorum]|uniref:hypothetical protein n=1 Tax=Orbus wheelerorum TaxID=3074111 RepID=UPI00370D2900
MNESFQFSGLARNQIQCLIYVSLTIGFLIGGAIFFLLAQYLVFTMGMTARDTPWLPYVIFGSLFIGVIVPAILAAMYLSRVMKKTWTIKFTPIGITIHQQNKEPEIYTLTELKKINLTKVKLLMGFNRGVQLAFNSKKVAINVVNSPILFASNQQDKAQFLLFIDYLYSHIIEREFELKERNRLISEILQTLADNTLIEHKLTFIKKQSSF